MWPKEHDGSIGADITWSSLGTHYAGRPIERRMATVRNGVTYVRMRSQKVCICKDCTEKWWIEVVW